ncbi:MAG: hypothetical protein DHS20C05_03160 [Hyphococcus sp.]|nr:MAG: hypothetical protein DHS20C05_03160 [Marinicaulis sp.]
MPRIITIILLCLATICIGAIGALGILFNTDGGRAWIVSQAETSISKSIDGQLKIGAIKGNLPGHIILSDIEISDEAGIWLTLDQAELKWRPLTLLSKRYHIENVALTGAIMVRSPIDKENDEEKAPLSLRFPDNLPNFLIDRISLEDIQTNIGSVQSRMDGGGKLRLSDKFLEADLTLNNHNGHDSAAISAMIHVARDQLDLDIDISSEPDGLLASVLNLDDGFTLKITSVENEKLTDIKLDGNFGEYGTLSSTIKGEFFSFENVHINSTFNAGPKFSKINELEGTLTASALIERKKRGGVITLEQLQSSLGMVVGSLEWKATRGKLLSLDADLKGKLAPQYRPEIQDYLGDEFNLKLSQSLNRSKSLWSGTFKTKGATLSMADFTKNEDQHYSGNITLTATPNPDVSFLKLGLDADGQVIIDPAQSVIFKAFTAQSGKDTFVSGGGAYSIKDDEILLKANFEAAPDFVSNLTPTAKLTDVIAGEVSISGALASITVISSVELPVIEFNNTNTPPIDLNVAVAGLPRLPNGEINAKAKQGTGSLSLALRSSKDGTVSFAPFSYQGDGFSFRGSGALNPQTEFLNIDLTYTGDEAAEPWPGLNLTGDMKIIGRIARDQTNNDLIITADRLQTKNISISNLDFRAQGPSKKISTTINANAIATRQTGLIENLKLAALINLQDDVNISLAKLDGLAANNTITLKQPASIIAQDGITLSDFKLGWGRTGEIIADAYVSKTHWRADASLSSINIPGADSRISLKLDLDTNKSIPAKGEFQLSSLLTTEQSSSIKGEFQWDGQQAIIKSLPDSETLDLQISLPVKLQKAPAISVMTDGDLNGFARYNGQASVLTAYLPPILQTLEGILSADITLAGSMTEPKISGEANITNGAYTELQSGFSLDGLHIEAKANYFGGASEILLSGGAHGAGQPDKDTIILDGGINVSENSTIDLSIRFNEAELSAYPVKSILLNGDIKIDGALDAATATGDIRIDELNAEIITPENTGLAPIEVIMANDDNSPDLSVELSAVESKQTALDYRIQINADDRIFVRGRGLESEWAANINTMNDRGSPLILGRMNLQRGWLDFSGRRFDLTRGIIEFDRLSSNNPLVDIRAAYETSDGVTAIIKVSGRAQQPVVELTSTPTMPSEDVMALVLFGKSAGDLTALESLQTAQALASLGGIGPFGGEGLTGSLRQATGLDLLNFDVDPENGGGSLTIGKYVADGLFVSATQDAKGKSGAVRVEYDITDDISVETEIRQDGDQTVSANWKRDF